MIAGAPPSLTDGSLSAAGSQGTSAGNSVVPAHASFTIRANGQDGVTIRYAGEMGRLWINGLELREQMK